MEENVIVAGHKLFVKMSINLLFTTHDRERRKELLTPMWIYWVFKNQEREMFSAVC
jgi:hypothetical protein